MFNDEFFPTPKAVIKKMLAPLMQTYTGYRERGFSFHNPRAQEEEITTFPYEKTAILDPSAGSGAILDYIKELFHIQAYGGHMKGPMKLYCFETDPTLQATLQGKNYRMLGHDFLKYSGDMPISLILMNPPFSEGDKHVLHAYKILAPGGKVVALVNSETLRNPHTRTRQLLANLIEKVGGEVEELGQCFKDSERVTDVEVSLIRLQKPNLENRFTFDWQNKTKEREFDTTRGHANDVTNRDLIGTMLTQYDCLREQYLNLLKAIDGIKHYGAGLTPTRGVRDAWRIARDIIEADKDTKEGYHTQYLNFTEEMRQQIWQVVLDKVDIQKFMTNAVRENFSKYSEQQGYMDFTKENVGQLVSMVLNNTGNILEVAIGQLFDKFTEHYYENRQHVEGWKTNSRYKVNRKLILPNWVEFGEYSAEFSVDWRHRSAYEDVDKVMCYLTGERYETTHLISHALETKFKELGRVGSGYFDGYCQSKFFKIRFFKKGTIHLEFLDEKLWQEFNLRACAGKLWLPDEEMQAYQQRKESPFAKATAAPGTEQATVEALGQRHAVLQQLLGPADETPRMVASYEPEEARLMPTAVVELVEEAQVMEEVTPVEPVVMKVAPVAETAPAPLVASRPAPGRNKAARRPAPTGQFALFEFAEAA